MIVDVVEGRGRERRVGFGLLAAAVLVAAGTWLPQFRLTVDDASGVTTLAAVPSALYWIAAMTAGIAGYRRLGRAPTRALDPIVATLALLLALTELSYVTRTGALASARGASRATTELGPWSLLAGSALALGVLALSHGRALRRR